jgi:hypothetical protein
LALRLAVGFMAQGQRGETEIILAAGALFCGAMEWPGPVPALVLLSFKKIKEYGRAPGLGRGPNPQEADGPYLSPWDSLLILWGLCPHAPKVWLVRAALRGLVFLTE